MHWLLRGLFFLAGFSLMIWFAVSYATNDDYISEVTSAGNKDELGYCQFLVVFNVVIVWLVSMIVLLGVQKFGHVLEEWAEKEPDWKKALMCKVGVFILIYIGTMGFPIFSVILGNRFTHSDWACHLGKLSLSFACVLISYDNDEDHGLSDAYNAVILTLLYVKRKKGWELAVPSCILSLRRAVRLCKAISEACRDRKKSRTEDENLRSIMVNNSTPTGAPWNTLFPQ